MSNVNTVILATDKSTRALVKAFNDIQKVAADLAPLGLIAQEQAYDIEAKQAQIDNLNKEYDNRVREGEAELRLKLLENETIVIDRILEEAGDVRVSQKDLSNLRMDLEVAKANNEDAISEAVQAAINRGDDALRSAIAAKEADHRVAMAEIKASTDAKDTQIEGLIEQVADLRAQLVAERETRLEVARAESGRQGVIVNAGK